jgi:exo-beta-1,3-glucanase (GH17 family)/cellulose synthase/poly-beta-1,6-N-acetylglucosamine synthase-like glycosyltransferase
MTRINIIIATLVAAVFLSLWSLVNRPEQEPAWPGVIQGFCFSPMRLQDNPNRGRLPPVESIDADLALLAGTTNAVRTYTVDGTLGKIPALARKHGINVALGAWLSTNEERNDKEVEKLIQIAQRNQRNVVRVIVGNEVLLRNDLPIDKLTRHLDHVRRELGMPVSTAEPWHIWLKNPQLVKHVDYIAVHMLPYWESIPINKAVDYVVNRMNQLKARFPGVPIVIAEVGWPSNGRARHGAEASAYNEATFLRRFLQRAEQEHYIYYVMEAFDQPWKTEFEGAVGAYWGVFDVMRKPKFAFSEPIVGIPEWRLLAAISVLIALITFALLTSDSVTLQHRGRGFLAVVAYALATAAVLIIYDYLQQYLSWSAVIVGILMLIGMIGVVIVVLVEAHEWAEALWAKTRRRGFVPLPVDEAELPMVSIHVPAYNEPPDMLIETLEALARLDYPRYEVVVIDNNTTDPAVWQPVEAWCRARGGPFRFFHVSPLEGYKSGALNYALQHTAPEARIIGVIDSDYVVDPTWLHDLVPQFTRPEIAIVQAPQDYRDTRQNAFKSMTYAEYRGFFYIGMVTRNDRNAIIQHGTMTLVRRSVLEEVGGWSEWCITEDAELGLMILRAGHQALYIPRSYGRGLMPDTFSGYRNQRFRWAYGSMQIMRHHAGDLMGLVRSRLSSGQRYHFVAGWLPWIADGMNLIYNLAALGWSLAMLAAPLRVDPPLMIFSILPLVLFCFKMAKVIYLYRGVRIVGTARQTLAAALAGLSLSHTIARAILLGLATRSRPFLRTPKLERASALWRALATAREETLLAVALWLAAGGLALQNDIGMLDLLLWIIVLLVQSVPYVATTLVSVISAFPRLSAHLVCGPEYDEADLRIQADSQGSTR